MSLNCREIDLILKEAQLEGAFIQKVLQTSYTTLVLGLYNEGAFNIFFSLEGSTCRFNVSKKKFVKPDKPLRFMELLRSKIIGYKIERAEQLNADRIVKFDLKNVRTDEHLFFYVKLWSGAANIILTDAQHKIIDAFYRRPAKKEITGEFFLEPPPLSSAEIKAKLEKFKIRNYDTARSFNAAIDEGYESESSVVNVENLQKQLLLQIAEKKGSLKEKKKKLERELNGFENPDTVKMAGDLILSNLAHIAQTGEDFFTAENYQTGEPMKIKIDRRKSPQENAQDYYTKAKKIISGRKTLADSIEVLDKQIAALGAEQERVTTLTEIVALKKLLEKQRTDVPLAGTKNKGAKNFSGLKFNIDGFFVLVGRSATENDELLRHCVRGSDIWLHVRDYSGGYVFIKVPNKKTVPLNVLIAAGNLAVYYSKAKRGGEATVYYTAVKNLRRAKNAKKGTVLPEHEKTLFITLDKAVLEKNELGRIM